jgi:ABC-2 type transport system ATP-binding protein
MAHAVEVSGLSYAYRTRKGERQALDSVSFSVKEGETYGLLGPNGSGKTTLFRILSTFFPAPAGAVRVCGVDAAKEPEEVRRQIGVVFQSPALDKRLSVRENLMHQGHLYGLSGKDLSERIARSLARLGISDRAGDQAGELSGGLQRRVELAKGLLHAPKLVILDEPSTGMDPGARKDMWSYLKDLKEKDGATVLLTTHWMEEAERCDRLAILSGGKVVAGGTPDELKRSIGGDVVSLEGPDLPALASRIKERFQIEAAVTDGVLRLEVADGHALAGKIAQAFPELVQSSRVGRPTLEDVFIDKTGHRFWREESA